MYKVVQVFAKLIKAYLITEHRSGEIEFHENGQFRRVLKGGVIGIFNRLQDTTKLQLEHQGPL